jgi:hypothetical protein
VREAERRLEGEALASGRTLEDVKAERQLLFDRWLAVQAQGEAVAGAEQWSAPKLSGG